MKQASLVTFFVFSLVWAMPLMGAIPSSTEMKIETFLSAPKKPIAIEVVAHTRCSENLFKVKEHLFSDIETNDEGKTEKTLELVLEVDKERNLACSGIKTPKLVKRIRFPVSMREPTRLKVTYDPSLKLSVTTE